MKRRVLCVFILVLWALIVCTFLSIRIEQLMLPQVTMIKTDDRDPTPNIPLDSLFWDDMGMHLYRAWEGSGWEKGTRVNEESQGDYTVGADRVDLKFMGSYIRYASNPLRVGDQVVIQTEIEQMDDHWVAVFPEGVPQYEVSSEQVVVQDQTDTALLMSVTDAPQPFMEDRAKSFVPTVTDEFAIPGEAAGTYYSLLDVQQFMSQVPLLSLLLAIFVFTLILWGYSCTLAKRAGKHRACLIANSGIAVVLLLCIPFILHILELPSSLLPQYHIVDFGITSASLLKYSVRWRPSPKAEMRLRRALCIMQTA